MSIQFKDGIKISGSNLWFDATRSKDFSFVSHAHTDHAVRHKKVVTSTPTALIYRHRILKSRGSAKTDVMAYDFHESFTIRGKRYTLYPSGHILGSAQILVEDKERTVYTGDFKMTAGATCEKIEVVPCDTLIMECTYGNPHYVFPDRAETIGAMIDFVKSSFTYDRVPVILAYSLGKAQEAVKILGDHGFQLSLHSKVFEMVKLYEELGVSFQGYELFSADRIRDRVVIAPPGARDPAIKELKRRRTAMLTGWALNKDMARRFGRSTLIPLSDHADFAELLAYVLIAKPRRVFTFHGSPDFSQHLRKKGIRAEHLPLGVQLKLWK